MTHSSRAARPRPHPGGFTLIEIAVVIVVLSLLLAMIAGLGTAMLGQQRREATRQKLAGVETAIALFVSQNKRLPCPADGRISGTTAGAGSELINGSFQCTVAGAANTQTHGVVPWAALGLAEPDVTDGWGNRLTYRVAPELVLTNSMDLTSCDPGGGGGLGALNLCDAACTTSTFPDSCTPPSTYTQDKGLKVRTLHTTVTLVMSPVPTPSTGAAYVVISHGENGAGAYNNQGALQSGSTEPGTLEASNNAANVTFAHSSSTAMTDASAFIDDFPSYPADTDHFDDFVLRPSILSVATKAQLGPRAH